MLNLNEEIIRYCDFRSIYYINQTCSELYNKLNNKYYKRLFWVKYFNLTKVKFNIILDTNYFICSKSNRLKIIYTYKLIKILLPESYNHYQKYNFYKLNNKKNNFKNKKLVSILKPCILYKCGPMCGNYWKRISKEIITSYKNKYETNHYDNVEICNTYNIPINYKSVLKNSLILKSLIN